MNFPMHPIFHLSNNKHVIFFLVYYAKLNNVSKNKQIK